MWCVHTEKVTICFSLFLFVKFNLQWISEAAVIYYRLIEMVRYVDYKLQRNSTVNFIGAKTINWLVH